MAAAPYLYQGWGSPPNPATVMNATGVKWFTMAFILSSGYCDPMWDGSRPLTGGVDQQAINTIRAYGGDVVVSAGGWSGSKLGENCNSAGKLAAAYQKAINALQLKAFDVDIEATEFGNATLRQRSLQSKRRNVTRRSQAMRRCSAEGIGFARIRGPEWRTDNLHRKKAGYL